MPWNSSSKITGYVKLWHIIQVLWLYRWFWISVNAKDHNARRLSICLTFYCLFRCMIWHLAMMQLEWKIRKMDVRDEEWHESRFVFRDILHTCRRRNDSEFTEVNVETLKEASRKCKDNFYKGLSKEKHVNCP